MFRQRRVVDYIVEQLSTHGVEYVFGVDGANIEDFYDAAFFHAHVHAVLAKHEFSAATMADGYSRAGCGLGVVMATSGGGALNLVPGLGESLTSRIPVLALVGQAPIALDGRGSFQDTSGCNGALDAEALFSTISVYCRRVTSAEQIVTALPEAITAARRGGPAVLLLPKDIQQSAIRVTGTATPAPTLSTAGDLEPMARELRCVRGPVTIIAGEQVARDDARTELDRLRTVLRARVATVPDAKDVSGSPDLGHSSALGVTGVMGHPGVAAAIEGSALCLLVGTRLNVTARTGLDDALKSTATMSIGTAEPYVPCTHVHSDDLRASLIELTMALADHDRLPAPSDPDSTTRAELVPPPHDGGGIGYRAAISMLDAALPDSVDIVVDAGNTGAAAIHNLPVRRGGRFIVALGMGGMGYSFGAAVGMAFGRTGANGSPRRVVVVAGDGSFFMHGMEVHTAMQYRLPITFVLFNNNAHAMCVTREQIFYGDLYSYNRFRNSRLGAGLATMFPGLPASDVDELSQLPSALRAALSAHGPSVVSIACSADEIPPFAPFLAALGQSNGSGSTSTSRSTAKENNHDVPART
jgi:acetolactate synthase-1/2/3 large subunit